MGSPTSRLNWRRACATLSRTSCTAVFTSTFSSNSTTTVEEPSRENERMVFTPLMVLATSSTRRVISCSTASAEAPGYGVRTIAIGIVMSGIWSTDRRWYENTPSTMKATIIMVANTGLLIEMRVKPMAASPWWRS